MIVYWLLPVLLQYHVTGSKQQTCKDRDEQETVAQGKKKDPLFSMCKESEKGKEEDAFVRIVFRCSRTCDYSEH